jgi:hypothetical protein
MVLILLNYYNYLFVIKYCIRIRKIILKKGFSELVLNLIMCKILYNVVTKCCLIRLFYLCHLAERKFFIVVIVMHLQC